MIWADTRGGPTPIGTKVDTITIDGRSYDVWKGTGPGGTDVVSYVDTKTTTRPDLALAPFFKDAVARGATSPDSWVTSIQLGFEPWKGGAGLAIDDFTYTPNAAPTSNPEDEDDDEGKEKERERERDETTAPDRETVPADVVDLTAMHLTLPTGKDGKAEQVDPDQLNTFTDPDLFHTTSSGGVLMRAPVQGASTSTASGATRTELRQREEATGDLAAWDSDTGQAHEMSVTMNADATHSTDHQEVIIAQIHSEDSTPPLYLAVDQSPSSEDTLSAYADGHKVEDLLTGITPDTTFTATITVPGDDTAVVTAAKDGKDSRDAQTLTVPASTFTSDHDGWYFTAGAYNKSPITGGGTSYTQVLLQDLTITG